MAQKLRKVGEVREAKLKDNLHTYQELDHKLEANMKSIEKLIIEGPTVNDLKTQMSDAYSRRKVTKERVRIFKTKMKTARVAIDRAIKE